MAVDRKDVAFLLGSLLIASIVPAAAFFFVPSFINMFSGFPELWPTQTRILFSHYRLSLLFPALMTLAWYFWPKPTRRNAATLLLSGLGTFSLCALGWWAMTPQELVLEAIGRSHP